MITLFKKNETNFETNGLGSLDKNILNPEISWKDNGAFTLEFRYPLFAKHGKEIENSSIIRANDPESSNLFFVYKITPSMGYVHVLCYQISYKLAFNSIGDTNIVNKNGQNALTQMSSSTQYAHGFTFNSDIQTTANSRVVRKNPIEFLLDSKLDNSFINRWGGHIVRHNFNIAMMSAYGSNKGYTIRHRKDLTGYEAEFDESTVITRIRPIGADGLLLPEIYVDSPLINAYVEPRIQQFEYSDVKVKQKDTDDEGFSTPELAYEELRRLAQLEFSKNKVDQPDFSAKVEFVNLKDTQEYQDLRSLKQLLPGDVVKVIHSDDNFNIEAQMVEYKWNPLNQSYISITLGNYTKSFTSTVVNTQNEISQIAQQAQSAMTAANVKNTVYTLTYKPTITKSSSEGDLLYLKNGDKIEMWILEKVNGELQWVLQVSDATQEELKAQMAQAKTDIDEALDSANLAVDKANANVAEIQANTQLINDVNAIANNAKSQAQTAATNAQTALTSANTANDNANKAISDAGKLSEDVLALDTIANQAKSDADTALINANKGITDAKTALDKATGVDTRVTTEITNVNNTVATKANSTKVDALSDTVSSQGTAISQNATDIKLKADSTVVNAIKGTVDSQGTLISQNASDIKIKADKSSVDTLSGRVLANETAIDVTAQGVSTLVTKTDSTNTSLSQFKQDYEGFKGTVYSKTQTDTKISTVQSTVDNFKTTVSNIYSSKSETDNKVAAVQSNVDKIGTNIAYAWSQDGKNKFTRVKPNENLWVQSNSVAGYIYTSSEGISPNTSTHQSMTTLIDVGNNSLIYYTVYNPNKIVNSNNSNRLAFFDVNNVFLGVSANLPQLNGSVTQESKIAIPNGVSKVRLGCIAGLSTGNFDSSVKVKFEFGNEPTIYTTLPQDDYDNAVPRYIGRSIKDSNNPSDYKWEPNPERKPWTAYAQDVNGKGLSLMPYGENLLVNSRNSPRIAGYQNTNAGTVSNTNDGTGIRVTYVSGEHYFRFNAPTNSDMGGFKAGKTYILSSKIRGKRDISSRFEIQLVNGRWINFDTGVQDYSINETLDTYVISIVTIPSNAIAVYASYQHYNQVEGDWFELRDTKLELANTMNIPTPWTPAPSEDPLGAIPKYIGTAALPYDDWTKYDWRLSSDWNQVKTSTEFEQTDKEIALKADQTTVNTITGRVSTAEGSITTMAGQIALKASKTDVDTVKGRVTSAEGTITTMAGQIALKANQADVNTITGKVSSLESSFTIQSGQITALNTKTDGQTTQIGSLQSSYSGLTSTVANVENSLSQNNLVYNSTLQSGSDGWTFDNGFTQSSDRNINGNYIINFSLESNPSNTWYFARSKQVPIGIWKTYAYRVNLMRRTDISNIGNFAVGIEGFDVNGTRVEFKTIYIDSSLTDDSWFNYSDSYTFTNPDVKTVCFTLATDGFGHYIACQPILVNDSKVGSFVPDGMDKAQITQLATDINLRVSKGDVTSQINIEAGRTLIDTKQLLLNADNVKFSGNAFIPSASIQNLSADKINTGTLNASNVNITNMNASNIKTGTLSGTNLSMDLTTGAVQFKRGYIEGSDGRIRLDLDNSYFKSYDSSNNGFEIRNGIFIMKTQVWGDNTASIIPDFLSEGGGINITGTGGVSLTSLKYKASIGIGSGGLADGTSSKLDFQGDARFWNNMTVLGSKNAIHVTRDGVRATPAYETAESYLGDIGRSYTRENYEVWVEIDPLFSDTVNIDIAYEVFLQAYDNARFWVSDFKSDKFLIKSDKPMARFAWEIKAKRRGYENDRLVLQEGMDNEQLVKAFDAGALTEGETNE